MAHSILENKVSDTPAAALFKPAASPQKADGEDDFYRVLDGCVKECVGACENDGEAAEVKAEAGKALGAVPVPSLIVPVAGDGALTTNGAVGVQVNSAETPAEGAAVASPDRAAVNAASTDNVINAVKSNRESAPAADIVIPAYVPTVADTAASNVAVGVAKTDRANATAAEPPLSSNPLTVKTAAANASVNRVKGNTATASTAAHLLSQNVMDVNNTSAATVAVDSTATNIVNTTAADSGKPSAASAEERAVKVEGAEETQETGDTDGTDGAKVPEDGDCSSVLTYISGQGGASAIATPSQKVTERAVEDNPSKVKEDNSGSRVTDGAMAALSYAQEKASNAVPEVKAVLAGASLKTIASPHVATLEAVPSEGITDLMPAESGKVRHEGGPDKVVSESAETKVHVDEKKLLNTGAADFVSKKADSVTDGRPEPELVRQTDAPALAPVKETRQTVQHHGDLPVNTVKDPIRADNVNSGAPDNETAPVGRVSALYANTASYGSDGFERRDENAGKNQETLKADGVKSGVDAVFQSNNEKFRTETVDSKPAEAVRTEAVYEKLETGVKMSLARGGSEISLRLAPEHLGALHIRLSLDEGSVKARIVVESSAAKTVLDSDSARLKEVFAAQGLSLDRYTIELGVNSNSAGANPFSENGAKGEMYNRQSAWNRGGDKCEQPAEAKTGRWSENTRKSIGGVDLFV